MYDPTVTTEICGSGPVREEWTNLITFVKGIRQMHEGRLNRDKHKASQIEQLLIKTLEHIVNECPIRSFLRACGLGGVWVIGLASTVLERSRARELKKLLTSKAK